MNIVVIAPKGKMGKVIVKASVHFPELKIVGAVGPKNREYIGKDVGIVAETGKEISAIVYDDLEKIIEKADGIIDFSAPDISMNVLQQAKKYGKKLVCGTTGFTESQKKAFQEAGNDIPIILASNTSKAVNLLHSLLEIATKSLGKDADIEIIEMHDRNKKDAPSGTSLELGETISHVLDEKLEEVMEKGRSGVRKEQSIGYHSVRAGDISSSHTIMFGLQGERLELTHHAHNWDCFGTGACEAILFLNEKEKGCYTMKDVVL